MKFFSLDSPFHKYGTIVFDLLVLNILWLTVSVFTIGILTPLNNAALFNSIQHTFLEEDGYMLRSYVGIFRRKILRGLALSGLYLLANAIAIFNIWAVWSGLFSAYFLLPLYIMIYAELTVSTLYASALLAETDMTLKQLLKYGFLLANKHVLISIACIAAIAGFIYAIILINNLILLFLGIAPLFWLMGWLIYKKVFSKYYLDKLL